MISFSKEPSDSAPGPWVQASSVTKNSPATLKTARTKPSASTLSAPPRATSAIRHSSMRFGAGDIGPLVIDQVRPSTEAFPERRRRYDREQSRPRSSSDAEERAQRSADPNWARHSRRPAVPQLLDPGPAGGGVARQRMPTGARQTAVGAAAGVSRY